MSAKIKQCVIGIDGGGTKTVTALADLKGKILKIAKSGSSSPRNLGIETAINNIARGIKKVLPENKQIKIISTFIGLPAVEEEFKSKKEEIKKNLLKNKEISLILKGKITIGSDQIAAFRSGTDKKNGILLIAGTGCVAHGWRDKKEVKASGWGWLADEGSAFWIGQRTYQAALKDLDGRGPKTLLRKLVFSEFKIKENTNLLNRLIYSKEPNQALSPLSFICDVAAEKGDKVARSILFKAGQEQALSVNTVIKKLNFQKERFPLILIGGLFKSKIYLNTVKKEIKKIAPKAEFIGPEEKPVKGAVKLAIEQTKNEDYKNRPQKDRK